MNSEDPMDNNEDFHRLITEHTTDMISKHDADGIFLFVSPACVGMVGYSPDELIGQNVYHFFHPQDLENIKRSHTTILKSHVTYTVSYRFKHKQGNYVWVEASSKTIRDPKTDEIKEIIASTRDITERKRMEEALRKSDDRWQFALEGAGDGVWDWNAVTNEVYFSRQWKAMLGYAEDEIGTTLDEWKTRVHPDDLKNVMADIERHFSGKTEFYRNEHRVQCKDGSYKWILDRGKIISWTKDGKPKRVIGTHKDISARKKAEAEKEKLISELQEAMKKVKTLSGLLPICSYCKKIRDDKGYWRQIDLYIREHSEVEFSHGLCNECIKKHYPNFKPKKDAKK